MELINKISLPVALFGAINYGLVGLFRLDLLDYLDGGTLQQAAMIIIGVAGVVATAGMIAKR